MLFQNDYSKIAVYAGNIRILALQSIASIGQGHVGGSFSIADTLAVLYGKVMFQDCTNPNMEKRDYLVVSKGHCGPAVYATLALKGYFPVNELITLNRPKTSLPSHCDRLKTKGVDMTTGSLGQGASSACGIALGNKIKGYNNYTYLILGDGECNEGQVWEAAEFAANKNLCNLIGFIDWNKKQLDGFTKEISGGDNYEQRFKDFGWHSVTIDGHDINAIYDAIELAKTKKDKPTMIVLDTIKGKGLKLAEETASNHSMVITKEQFVQGVNEINEDLKQYIIG